MPEGNIEHFANYDFSGGLNTEVSPRMLPEEFSPNIENLVLDEVGDLKKRRGYDYYVEDNLGAPIMGLHRFYRKDGFRYLIAVSGGVVYAKRDGAPDWFEIYSTLDMEDFVGFEVWENAVYFTTASDGAFKWTEGDADPLDHAPKGAYITEHVNRLFIAGDTAYPSRLYFTEAGHDDKRSIVGEQIYPEADEYVALPHIGIIENSETVMDGDDNKFDKGSDYEINYSDGELKALSDGGMVTEKEEEFSGSPDTYLPLDGYEIVEDSETVTRNDTEYTEGTDYEMDNEAGRIKVLPDGSMPQSHTETLEDYSALVYISLEKENLIEGSISVEDDNGSELKEGRDFVVNYGPGEIRLLPDSFIFEEEDLPELTIEYDHVDEYTITYDMLDDDFFIDYDVSAWVSPDGIDHYIDVSSHDGDQITGIQPAFEELVIFKHRSAHILYGYAEEDFQLRRFLPSTGCIAPNSIATYQSRIMFLSHKGVMMMDQDGIENLSSGRVQDILDDCDRPEEAAGIVHDKKYWLAYAEEEDYNDTVLVYDLVLESWMKFTNIEASCFAEGSGRGEIGRLWWGDPRTSYGFVYELAEEGDHEDIESPIRVKYETPRLMLDSPELVKLFRRLQVDVDLDPESELEIEVETEEQDETFVHEKDDPPRSLRRKQGPYIQFNIEETSKDPVKIKGYVVEYRPRRFMR